MAFFDIVLQTVGSLHPGGEPSEYISTYEGIIRCHRERDDRLFRVGKLKAYRIHADQARQDGESVFDVCDAHSQEMHDLYVALFDAIEDTLKEPIRDRFDAFSSDILVVDYALLHPRWRGLKIGLLAVRKMIDLLGGGCGLAVSHIAPLYAEAEEFARVPSSWIPSHATPEDRNAARSKLRRYFRRMGFARIGRTRFHGLSLVRITPSLSDLLRPTR